MLLTNCQRSNRLQARRSPSSEAPDLSQTLRNRDIVCFAHDFSADPLSKTQIMRILSRDNRILWVNSVGYRTPTVSKRDLKRIVRKLAAAATPVREQAPNIFVLNPLTIPAFSPVIRAFNRRFLRFQVRRAMKNLSFRRPVNFVFNPAAAVVAGQLGEEMLIYYCVDEYSALAGMPTQRILEMERHLIGRADHVFVSAQRLYQTKSTIRPDICIVRHGVDFDHFAAASRPRRRYIPTSSISPSRSSDTSA